MAKAIGRLVNIGLGKEGTRGTAAAATHWLPKTELTFQDKRDKVESSESLGVIDEFHEAFTVACYAEGDINGEIRDKSFGMLLYGLLGTVSSAVNETTAYDHTFTLDNDSNSHQSLSISVDDPAQGQDFLFKLAMLSSLTIDANLGEISTFSSNFISKKANDWTALTASYTLENKFVSRMIKVKLAANIAGLAAASEIDIKSVSLTVAKNLTRDHLLGTCDPEDIHNQQFNVEGEMVINLENTTYKDYYLDNTYRAMQIDMLNTEVTIGATSNPELKIQLPRVEFMDWTPERPNNELSTQTIGFKGYYDVTNDQNSIHQIILTNETTSY